MTARYFYGKIACMDRITSMDAIFMAGNNAIFVSAMPAKQHDSNTAISTSFSPGTRPVLGAARQFFNQITTAASDACEFRSPTSSRGDNGVVGLTPWHSVRAPLRSHVPLAGRVMSAVYPPSEFAGFSFKNPAPMTFCKAVKRRGQPGAVENPGNPPSCGASIGGVPRFMGGL